MKRPVLWSTFGFLIPFVLAFNFELYYMSGLIALSTISSLLYHYNNQQHFKKLDIFFAMAVILANFYLGYLYGFMTVYFLLALIFVGLATYFFYKEFQGDYQFNHSMWHLFSIAFTTVSILGYVYA